MAQTTLAVQLLEDWQAGEPVPVLFSLASWTRRRKYVHHAQARTGTGRPPRMLPDRRTLTLQPETEPNRHWRNTCKASPVPGSRAATATGDKRTMPNDLHDDLARTISWQFAVTSREHKTAARNLADAIIAVGGDDFARRFIEHCVPTKPNSPTAPIRIKRCKCEHSPIADEQEANAIRKHFSTSPSCEGSEIVEGHQLFRGDFYLTCTGCNKKIYI